MIAQYPGKCAICRKPVTPGKDLYEPGEKKNFHAECRNKADLFDQSEAERVAEDLLYIDVRELDGERKLPIDWFL